jgi:hypothetical protein
MGDVVDIQPPGRDIGGHENPVMALTEVLNGLAALGLAASSVDPGDLKTLFLKAFGDPVHPVLGAGKN